MLTGGTLDRQSINCNRPFSSAFFRSKRMIRVNAFQGEGQLLLQNRPREGELGRESERLGVETS